MKMAKFIERNTCEALIMTGVALPENFGDALRVTWHTLVPTCDFRDHPSSMDKGELMGSYLQKNNQIYT
jgi:tetraacyldisaccharide-1-P 4'-kinase